MYTRPTLSEYVIARLVSMVVFIGIFYAFLIFITPTHYQTIQFHITLFILSHIILVFSIYHGTKQVAKELKVVEEYLLNIGTFKDSTPSVRFFAQEFETINLQLIQILRKMKKREKEKRKYTAKIKLKNRQRSDMLSAIAHEFRNPIASIMGYSQTLIDDEDISLELRLKFLNKIYNNGDKIEELLSRLLLWNRFESGEQKLQTSKFDIVPLIRDTAMNLEDKYKTREIVIEGSSLLVKADKSLIEIVLKNLIENALKYSTDKVLIEINAHKIAIIDSGVGISAHNIEKVTKKFFRTNEHTWENSMGLGLAIVKEILKLHEVTLKIESQEDYGSVFWFSI